MEIGADRAVREGAMRGWASRSRCDALVPGRPLHDAPQQISTILEGRGYPRAVGTQPNQS
jgi:hypothetical protein